MNKFFFILHREYPYGLDGLQSMRFLTDKPTLGPAKVAVILGGKFKKKDNKITGDLRRLWANLGDWERSMAIGGDLRRLGAILGDLGGWS